MKVVITAGGTSEKIDNVRKITNSSTGKLGLCIANEFLKTVEDVEITYICSKETFCPNDDRVKIKRIIGVDDLEREVRNVLENNDIDVFIHSMAVSDYKVDYVSTLEKLRNNEEFTMTDNKISSSLSDLVIVLKPTKKIISIIKDISPNTYLVGFKLLDNVTNDKLIEVATNLMIKNKCNLVVANDLENIRNGRHIGYIIDEENNVIVAEGKDDIAKKLVRRIENER